MEDMNFGSKMNMLVGKIIELFSAFPLLDIIYLPRLYFMYLKDRKKRVLENKVKYFLLRNACSFCIGS